MSQVHNKIEDGVASPFELRILAHFFDEEELDSILLRLAPFHDRLSDSVIFKILSPNEKKKIVKTYVACCYEEDNISEELDEIRELKKSELFVQSSCRNHLLKAIRTMGPADNHELVKALPSLIQTRKELVDYLNILREEAKEPEIYPMSHLQDDFNAAIKAQPLSVKKQLSYIYLRALLQEVKENSNCEKHQEEINQLCDSLEKRCKNWAKKEVSDSTHLHRELKELERDCQADMAKLHLCLQDNKGMATFFCEWFMVFATLGGVLLASSLYHGYKTGNYRPRFFDVGGEEALREVDSVFDLRL